MATRNHLNIWQFGALVPPMLLVALTPAQARDKNVDVAPYLEVQQVLVADLNNGTDVLTYTSVAAGIDTSLQTRQAEAQVSLRYERRFFYQDNIGNDDILSGLARGSVQVVPNVLSLEAGGIATRSALSTATTSITSWVIAPATGGK